MTHDILQSDIALAKRLMVDGHSDLEIITALARRRVDHTKAARLVDDLRNGRKAIAQPSLPPELGLKRPRSKNSVRESTQPPPARPREPEPLPEPPPSVPRRKKPTVIWIVAGIVLFLAIVVVGSALFQRYQPGAGATENQAPGAPRANAERAPRESAVGSASAMRGSSPTSVALELQPDGLRIRGTLVTRDKLLPTVISLLGLPNRTNQVSQTGTLIYAYDQHGLLIYSQPAGGTNSVVLDCEASGGANGTTSPFSGTLRVEDHLIGPDTDSKKLLAMKPLGLDTPKAGGTIWNGRYRDVNLVFAYLESLQRPSLIQLDLK